MLEIIAYMGQQQINKIKMMFMTQIIKNVYLNKILYNSYDIIYELVWPIIMNQMSSVGKTIKQNQIIKVNHYGNPYFVKPAMHIFQNWLFNI